MSVANDLLDEHHDPVGVSDFGDEIPDHCDVCGFALGWPDDTDQFGHDTTATVAEVRRWIERLWSQ